MNKILRKVIKATVRTCETGRGRIDYVHSGTRQRIDLAIVNDEFTVRFETASDNTSKLAKIAGVPDSATVVTNDDDGIVNYFARWPSYGDITLSPGGTVSQLLTEYEHRPEQIVMSRLVQRSFETGHHLNVEAGTGTGKSLAYLIAALSMNKPATVVTPTKALQDQLVKKDIPFLLTLPQFKDKTFAKAQGKNNYACKFKIEDSVTGNLKIADERFAQWYEETEDGDLESLTFELSPEDDIAVRADDDCPGQRHCPMGSECHYYRSRDGWDSVDVLVTNAKLMSIQATLGLAPILPHHDLVVIDEAHKTLGVFRDTLTSKVVAGNPVDAAINAARKFIDDEIREDLLSKSRLFQSEITAYHNQHKERDEDEVEVDRGHTFRHGLQLSADLNNIANLIWSSSREALNADDKRQQKLANRLRKLSDKLAVCSRRCKDEMVRSVDSTDYRYSVSVTPIDISEFMAKWLGQVKTDPTVSDGIWCNQCYADIEDHRMAVLNGRPFHIECVDEIDVDDDAEYIDTKEWNNGKDDSSKRRFVMTSATIAAPDMANHNRHLGITKSIDMVLHSPFDFKRNALLFVPNGKTPDPKQSDRWLDYVADEMERLVKASDGGAFLLFTSNRVLNLMWQRLEYTFSQAGLDCFRQGYLPTQETIQRFTRSGRGVLFGTKSYWEGVSVDGDPLRLVIIDKLPFAAPSPLSNAIDDIIVRRAIDDGSDPDRAKWIPFNARAIPEATIDLKQGAGRLIRTSTDRGVIAILDPRLRSKSYGSRILKSLPPAKQTDDVDNAIQFLRSIRGN